MPRWVEVGSMGPARVGDWLQLDGILGKLCLGIFSIRCQDVDAMTGCLDVRLDKLGFQEKAPTPHTSSTVSPFPPLVHAQKAIRHLLATQELPAVQSYTLWCSRLARSCGSGHAGTGLESVS